MKGEKGFQLGNTEARKKGKHKKTIQKEKEIEYIQERIRERLEPILDALILKCEQNDLQAIKEALDRLIGKPQQNVDMTTGGEKIGGFNFTKNESDNSDNKTND